ncbi:MAG TPA: BsuPI-related putative proteinase inhibitor [Longimicrobiaceae bacterium]|nr:BsuPI-related putative proteinase inhibitor [Longimicrobiaceae bacterium]
MRSPGTESDTWRMNIFFWTRLRCPRAVLIGAPVLVVLSGCTRPDPAPMPPSDQGRAVTESPATGPLVSSLQVETHADSLHFVLQVTNATQEAVPLTFRTGQSADFVVAHEGRELWRWSGDQMFTQAIRNERLAAGETRTFEASWSPPRDLNGTLTVRGFLTAEEHRADQQAEVRLP